MLAALGGGAPALPAQQPTRPPADTVRRPVAPDTARPRRDSVTVTAPARPGAARLDSVRGIPDSLPTKTRPDSIQPPLARGEIPIDVRVGPPLRWTRDSVLATGALTLADLLERVPGVTTYRTGWLASAQTAAYLGDFRRLRVFRDGVELDPADPAAGGVHDLLDFPLWQADDFSVERTASEVRVHMRTWTTRNTNAYTRVDIATGDEDTNFYRGFYGKRWGNGLALQVGAQQLGTGARNRLGGGGDATNPMIRLGWVRGRLSVDGLVTRLDRTRDTTRSIEGDALMRDLDSRRSESYVRVGWGDPERGVWAQAIANSLRFVAEDSARRIADTTTTSETDSITVGSQRIASRAQYVAAVGYTVGSLRASLTNRYRVFAGETYHAPALRLAFERPLYGVSGHAERTGVDSTMRVDLTGRVTPLRWLALQGSATRLSQSRDSGGASRRTDYQAEAAVRLGRLWIAGGVVVRDGATLPAPRVYELDTLAAVPEPERATGGTLTLRGRFYKDAYLDVAGVVWSSGGLYRPQYQARAEVGVLTNWLSRFPSGNLGIRAALVNEYRSRTRFDPLTDVEGDDLSLEGLCSEGIVRCAGPGNALTAMLEIRIQRGTLFYQLRNALNREFEQVPGFRMPRPINVYGVRWDFWG